MCLGAAGIPVCHAVVVDPRPINKDLACDAATVIHKAQ